MLSYPDHTAIVERSIPGAVGQEIELIEND
jgi:hypothetical protein